MSKPLDHDPYANLERAVERAISRNQHRMSVSPYIIRRLLTQLGELEKALQIKLRNTPIPHDHEWGSGKQFTHSHPRGDTPHDHHGARYLPAKPRIEI